MLLQSRKTRDEVTKVHATAGSAVHFLFSSVVAQYCLHLSLCNPLIGIIWTRFVHELAHCCAVIRLGCTRPARIVLIPVDCRSFGSASQP